MTINPSRPWALVSVNLAARSEIPLVTMGRISTRRRSAAKRRSSQYPAPVKLSLFLSAPTRLTFGKASLNTSSRFSFSSDAYGDTPVRLPPGELRLGTKAAADRITSRCEYDRNCRGRPHGWSRSRDADDYNDFRRSRDDIGCGGLGRLTPFAHDIIVCREVPTFDVPQITQPFLEGVDQMLCSSRREIRDVSSRLRLPLDARGK